MGKVADLTPKKRSVIVALAKEKLSYSAIAERVRCSKATVSKTLKLVNETGGVASRKRSGRPRCTSHRDDLAMLKTIKKQPFLTAADLKAELPCVTASLRTIRRRLCDEFKLRSRRAARKPLLNSAQVKKRLKFCSKYKNWTTAQWSRVMFSDESTFCQFGTHLYRVRRPMNMRYDRRYTVSTMKHPQKIMVWGCFSGKGRGSLYFMKPNEMVNAKKYIEILDAKLPSVMSIQKSTVFQQDGAPCHTAKVVQKWFKDKRITVLEWPGNSPDLNPIENLWELMKRRVAIKCPRNMQDLVYWLKVTWCQDISRELCEKLAQSMPRRIKAVIANKGQPTKY
jgi:transposase